MKNQKKSKQFINIPYQVMKLKTISQSEKMVYGFINGFTKINVCYASNSYIAGVVGLTKDTVSKCISTLIRTGMVKALAPKGRSRSLFTTGTTVTNDDASPSITTVDPVDMDVASPSIMTDNNIVYNIKNNIVDNIGNMKHDKIDKHVRIKYDVVCSKFSDDPDNITSEEREFYNKWHSKLS